VTVLQVLYCELKYSRKESFLDWARSETQRNTALPHSSTYDTSFKVLTSALSVFGP
jgi:hypothetical protein